MGSTSLALLASKKRSGLMIIGGIVSPLAYLYKISNAAGPKRGLDGGDGAKRHFVVVSVDDGRVGMGLQQGLGDLAALVAGKVAGLAGEDDHVGRLGLDGVVEALLAIVGRRSADGAFELDDLALAACLLDRPIGDPLTLEDEVRADESEEVHARLGERRIDIAVDQQHRDAGLLGVHDRRDQRFFLTRRQEDEVDPLRDHAVDVGDLLGRGACGVGIDELGAALGGFILHAGGLRQPPGVVAFGLGEADLVVVLFLERRDLAEGGNDRQPGDAAGRSDQQCTAINNHSSFLLLMSALA